MNQLEVTKSQIDRWYPLFVTPCYDQQITQPFFLSFVRFVQQAERIGLRYDIFTVADSLIPRSRNRAVAHFMENLEYTHLFFIDADTEFDFSSVIKLLLSDKDVIAAPYPFKEAYDGKLKFVVNFLSDTKNAVVDGDFIKVHDVGTGFMLIKRVVFEKMCAHYSGLRYAEQDGSTLYNLFNPHIDPVEGRYLSEGHAFCRYWREIGGEIWADPTLPMGHFGRFMYKGTMADPTSWDALKR